MKPIKTLRRDALVLSLPLLFGWATVSPAADAWTCQQAGLVRQVTLFYPDSPALLPCKVFYSKPDENVLPRALWRADNLEGYCEQKALALVEKLESLGWRCSADAPPADTSPSPVQ